MPYLEKLKAFKEGKDLTNAEIAKLSNIPLATITRIFNGSTPNPTFETFAQIAIALGASLDEIAGLKEPDEPPIPSRIEMTLDLYSALLKAKDEQIKDLKDEVDKERKEKHNITGVLALFIAFVLLLLTIEILRNHFGHF